MGTIKLGPSSHELRLPNHYHQTKFVPIHTRKTNSFRFITSYMDSTAEMKT